jgi:hypothetical protein
MSEYPDQELAACWSQEKTYALDSSHEPARRIVLRRDGHGPMGYYDRIHIFTSSHNHLILPAHNANGWRMKDEG